MVMSSTKLEEKLKSIKCDIKDFHDYFQPNFKRFNEGRRFIFETALTSQDLDILRETGKPQLEFNIMEAFISRLRGEFSKQEPSLTIFSRPDVSNPIDPDLIDFLERHLRAVILDSNRDNLQYNVFTDLLSGGFSAIKVMTDYMSAMSFDQHIFMKRCFDPTLVVFDKMAQESHKGDGRFSAELYPKTEDEIRSMFGSNAVANMSFSSSDAIGDFRWSYMTESGKNIALLADYYVKKMKKATIVKVAAMGEFPSQTMTVQDYERFAEKWESERIEQVPVVLGKSRKTDIQTVDRYLLCGSAILKHDPTDYEYIPHVFVDGNSLMMRKDTEGSSYQLCRSFVYHLKGIQRLKNFAGVSLANELENTVQHKWMIALESIADQYTDALTDVQKASVVVYNAYDPNNPDKQLPSPMAAPRAPIPPEIASTFAMSDQMAQAILGSYDASLGINDNQLSGAAITNGAMQSNPVAAPFIVNYMKAMNQIGMIFLDLIPKYMKTPRSVPIMTDKGKRSFMQINGEGDLKISYDSKSLEVNVVAGVSFEIQRSKAFQMILQLMQISPKINKFVTEGNGLEILLDNVDIRGIDRLKLDIEKFSAEEKDKEEKMMQMQMQKAQQDQQMQAMQMQMIQKNNPAELKREELKLRAMKDGADIDIKKAKLDIDYMLAVAEIENQGVENALKESEINARNARTDADLEIKGRERMHSSAMEILNLHHGNANAHAEREHRERMQGNTRKE